MTLIEGPVSLLSIGRAVGECENRWTQAGLGWSPGNWRVLVSKEDMIFLREEASTWVGHPATVLDGRLGDIAGVAIHLDYSLDPGHVRLRYEMDL